MWYEILDTLFRVIQFFLLIIVSVAFIGVIAFGVYDTLYGDYVETDDTINARV